MKTFTTFLIYTLVITEVFFSRFLVPAIRLTIYALQNNIAAAPAVLDPPKPKPKSKPRPEPRVTKAKTTVKTKASTLEKQAVPVPPKKPRIAIAPVSRTKEITAVSA